MAVKILRVTTAVGVQWRWMYKKAVTL